MVFRWVDVRALGSKYMSEIVIDLRNVQARFHTQLYTILLPSMGVLIYSVERRMVIGWRCDATSSFLPPFIQHAKEIKGSETAALA